jgi:IclR family pca regulon transcriptional regulator
MTRAPLVNTAAVAAGSARRPEGMAGLAKGLAVMEAFSDGRAELTVSQAAEATGVTRAAARRCLLQLADLGYLTSDGKFFRPTPRTLRLGAAYLAATPLPQLAQPHLAAARDVLGESVSIAVLDDGWVTFVARAEAARIVSTGVRVGARLPAYCSATGRVLLAGLPAAGLDDYLARARLQPRTERTVVDRDAVRDLVEQARREGFASTDEELELGMRSIAVPVTNSAGRVEAAVSVSCFSARASLEEMRRHFLAVVQNAAERIGRSL